MSDSDNEASMDSILGAIRKIIQEDDEKRKKSAEEKDFKHETHAEEPLILTEVVSSSPDRNNDKKKQIDESPEKMLEVEGVVMERKDEEPLDLGALDMSSNINTQSTDHEGVVSPHVSEAGALAFRELERSVRVGYAGETLEEVIKGLLTPMLQKWLDQNLVTIVQEAVDREIQRMVGAARKK